LENTFSNKTGDGRPGFFLLVGLGHSNAQQLNTQHRQACTSHWCGKLCDGEGWREKDGERTA